MKLRSQRLHDVFSRRLASDLVALYPAGALRLANYTDLRKPVREGNEVARHHQPLPAVCTVASILELIRCNENRAYIT